MLQNKIIIYFYKGYLVFHVEASDKDSGSNGKLEYKLKCDYDVINSDDVTINCPFVIHQNGDVTLTSLLDRENKNQYKVVVTVNLTCFYKLLHLKS